MFIYCLTYLIYLFSLSMFFFGGDELIESRLPDAFDYCSRNVFVQTTYPYYNVDKNNLVSRLIYNHLVIIDIGHMISSVSVTALILTINALLNIQLY